MADAKGRLPAAVLSAVVLFGIVLALNTPRFSAAGARDDPEALLAAAWERAQRVEDFTCRFFKHERVQGELKRPQTMDTYFRAEPFSIHLKWRENPGRIQRALYVAGAHVASDGTEQVLVEPSGAIARALKPKVAIPLHGELARKASRYTLDEFGFQAALERIRAENQRFAAAGVLTWDPVRDGVVDGRPTLVLTRWLPEAGGDYPNAKLVVELDAEWLLPVNVEAYADAAGTVLLEHYRCVGLDLNPGLDDGHFRF
jgi:hypothetical protein